MSSETQTLLQTPLAAWHKEAGARLAPFAGFEMPMQYSGIVAEHLATRTAASLFDVSHMGRLRFEGPRAAELLDRLLTRRVQDIKIGQVRYSLICNSQGGILDDVLVSDLETPSNREFFLLVVNASNRKKILEWIAPYLHEYGDVAFSDVTEVTAMIALQGPKSQSIIEKLFPPTVTEIGYYRAVVTNQMHKPCVLSRTGYTGEDGFELVVKNEDAPRVWENLLLAGREFGIVPAGLGARDTLRLEAGMPLYGHELNEEVDPFTAGLGFAVQLDGRDFCGKAALASRNESATEQVRVGLKVAGRRPAREGAVVLDTDNRRVGIITSGTHSPTLQHPIAMAYVPHSMANPGAQLEVDIRGSRAEAEVVPLPFYKRT